MYCSAHLSNRSSHIPIFYIIQNTNTQHPPISIAQFKHNNKHNHTKMSTSRRRDQSIKTYLRIKPTSQNEQNFISAITTSTVTIRGQQQFTYDHVFDSSTTNHDIFQFIGQPLIQHCIQGYNSCVLAYGQTASGKTYTMKGNQGNQGVIPLALKQLFTTIQQKRLIAEIRISYIEIYNENIIDLLSPTEAYLQIREDPRKNITILGLTQTKVSEVTEAMKLFNEGQSRRKFASNNLNVASSRSHAIFRMNIQIVHEDFMKTNSLINMVDLAGSEGVSRTKAEGSTRKEGENINKSILALSNVIRCMSEKQAYINFRDSKLTRILQNSLCNNSRSVVICTINPTALNYQQTLNTLKFGMYASQVKLELKKNISQTSQKMPQSQVKSTYEGLQPQQRVQYQENKRIISSLRQQNQDLRQYKKKLNQKIQFLQLDNHRLTKNLQNLQIKLKTKSAGSSDLFDSEQKLQYERQIRSLKDEMQIMADKYEALNQYSSKLQKNQRYLIERIAKYESQISILKQSVIQKQAQQIKIKNKTKTPIKQKQFKPNLHFNPNQQLCPLTIKSIIILKSQIIELKQTIFSLNQDVAGLIQERNQLLSQMENMRDVRDNQLKSKVDSQYQQGDVLQKKENKNLHIRVKKLQNQVQIGKNREKKLAKMLRACSETLLEQFNQFNEWYADKKQKLDSIKKLKFGSARRSSHKQNQTAQV